ncbi:MAG: hypothetical protein WCF57_17825 [Pyrinomonadaceae bacterium]
MKRCPTCNRTFTDDALSFCLDDGAPLLSVSDAPSSFDPGATMRYTEPRDTSSPTEVYRPGPPSGASDQIINPSWATIPGAQAATPPKKKSLLPWIIGGSVLLVVLGIGVVVLLAVLVSLNSNDNANNANNKNKGSGTSLTNANNTNNTNNANSSSSTSAALTDDFTDAKWLTGNFSNGNFWYQNGEYHMKATPSHSVVVYAPDKDTYYTQDSTVRVTARSISGTTPSYGYGLAVLGEMKNNQLEDYSFLIFTGLEPQYKVVLHKEGKETPIVSWTKNSIIRAGATPNQLEVRVKGDQMSFYINGQYVTSVKDTAGYKNGSVGFYTSDNYEVAFDDLEISR